MSTSKEATSDPWEGLREQVEATRASPSPTIHAVDVARLLAEHDRLASTLSRVIEEVEGLRGRARACKVNALNFAGSPHANRLNGKVSAYGHAADLIEDVLRDV